MRPEDVLEALIKAEQQQAPPAERMEEGWQRLAATLVVPTPGGALPSKGPDLGAAPGAALDAPLKLGTAFGMRRALGVVALVGVAGLGAWGLGAWGPGVSGLGGLTALQTVSDSPRSPEAEEPARSPKASSGESAQSSATNKPQGPRRDAALGTQSGAQATRGDRGAGAKESPLRQETGSPLQEGVEPPRRVNATHSARKLLAPPSTSASSFDAELALIRQAKGELDAGRTESALALLRSHARQYPRGVFAGEREALRVLVMCRGSSASEGRELARRFMRQRPQSPLVDRLRRACHLEDQ